MVSTDAFLVMGDAENEKLKTNIAEKIRFSTKNILIGMDFDDLIFDKNRNPIAPFHSSSPLDGFRGEDEN